MKHLIRRGVIALLVVGVISGIGRWLAFPPAFFDAITGATVHAREATDRELSGEYVLCMKDTDASSVNMEEVLRWIQEENREALIRQWEGFGSSVTISVREREEGLCEYAHWLCQKIQALSLDCQVRTYSDTLFRSRLLAGKYEIFVNTKGFMDMELLPSANYFLLRGEEMMRQAGMKES